MKKLIVFFKTVTMLCVLHAGGYSYSQNLAALAVNYPLAGNCVLSGMQDSISVKIRNLDISPVNNFSVSYRVNNGLPVTEIIPAIAANATIDYTFSTKFLRGSGVNDIRVYTSLPGDVARANDTARVRQVGKITSFPYYENFESNDGGFAASGTNSSWGWGSPNKAKMKPGEGSRSWYNGFGTADNYYLASDASVLTFPCYDFSNLQNPFISFKFFLEVENGWESVVLEYSTNGSTYQLVGSGGEPNGCNTQNWYNAGNTWSGNTDNRGGSWGSGCGNGICGKWVVARHCVDFLKGQPAVYFRLRFASTGTQQQAEGVGLDSLVVGEAVAPPFSFTANNACANQPIAFTPSLHPCITATKWDFADGTPVLSIGNAIHLFKNPGTYPVKLIATSYCGKQDTFIKPVTIFPPPPITRDANLLNERYCATASAVPLAGTRTPAGGSFFVNGNPASMFDPVLLGVGNHKVVYVYTEPAGNKCTTRDTQVVQVYLPDVSIDSMGGSYCLSSPSIKLKGSPAGGAFTIDGNAADSFSAADLGLGQHTIVYTYIDPAGCVGTATKVVDVVSNIVAQISGLNANYCSYEPPLALTGTPVGGRFTIDGANAAILNPSALAAGTHQVIYTYSDGGSCGDADTFDINIVDIQASITNLDSVYCPNSPVVNMLGNPVGGNFYIDGNPAVNFNPPALSVSTHKVLYVYTDPVYLCVDSVTKLVRIDKPTLKFNGINDSYCKNSDAVTLSATPSGGTFKLNGNTVTQIDPVALDTGIYTLVYSYTNPATNCTNTLSKNIYIAPLPKLKFVDLDSVFCITSDLVALKAEPSGGAFTVDNLPVQMLDVSVLDINQVHVVGYQFVEQNFGCMNSITKNIRVVTPPSVTISNIKSSYCLNDSPFVPVGNPSGGKFIINDTDTSDKISPSKLGAGTHKLTYYYNAADGCDATINQQINVLPAITGNIEPDPVSVCEGEPVTLTFNGDGNIAWNTGQTSKSITFTPAATQYYWVKATDCANFYDSALVTVKPVPDPDFSISTQEELIPFKITATATNAAITSILWRVDTSFFPEVNPLEYEFNTPGEHIVQLIVDSLGCSDTLNKVVRAIEKVMPIKLPNVFTPDNDGINDDFGINREAQRFVSQCVLQVFNRWGNLLFETSNPYERWDGTDKGAKAPDGVYFYILNASLTDNTPYKLTGSVQIIRGN
jgi:gliding motility-associated-like protein